MSNTLQDAIRKALSAPDVDPKVIDLRSITAILHRHFPYYDYWELARKVAEMAVAEGCRYLIWDPEA